MATGNNSVSLSSSSSYVRNMVLSVCNLKQLGDGPVGRVGAQMLTFATKFYLYGGADDKQAYSDLYSLEIEKTTWKELCTGGFSKPSARYGHSLSVWNDKLILFGGLASDSDTLMLGRGSFPPPLFIGPNCRRWVHRGSPNNQLFSLDPEPLVWREIFGSTPPSQRSFHAATVVKSFLLIHGGAEDAELQKPLSDLHVFNLVSSKWIQVSQTGQVPSARSGHKMVYCPTKDCVFLFGGVEEHGNLFVLNVSNLNESCGTVTLNWNCIDATNTAPVPRMFHTVDLVGNRIFVLAGMTSTEESDFYVYEIDKNQWSRPLYDGVVSVRAHTSAVLHDKLIVFGGTRERITTTGEEKNFSFSRSKNQRISKKLFFVNVLQVKEGEGHFKFKLIIVGDSGVGKSCLLTRFVQDVYSEFHVSTIGIDFKSVVTMIKGKLVTLQLWDTAGQERFGRITGNYYRNADAFALTFDATNADSFHHIRSWLKQIEEHHECGSSTVKLLIGNKTDMKDEIQISNEEALELANEIGAIYVPTSAKTAANVDAGFLAVANQLVDMRKKAAEHKTVSISSRDAGGVALTNETTENVFTKNCGNCASR